MTIIHALKARHANRRARLNAINDECCRIENENPGFLDRMDGAAFNVDNAVTPEACDRLLAAVHAAELEATRKRTSRRAQQKRLGRV